MVNFLNAMLVLEQILRVIALAVCITAAIYTIIKIKRASSVIEKVERITSRKRGAEKDG